MSATKVVSTAEARKTLPSLLDQVEDLEEHVVITRRGKPLAVLFAYEEYEQLLETLEVLSDPDLMKAIAAGEADIKKGDFAALEQYLADRENRLA